VLECSRLSLVKITEMGVASIRLNSVKQRVRYYSGMSNNNVNISFIVSLEGNDCSISFGRKVLKGTVVKMCGVHDRGVGYQIVAEFGNMVYKFSTIPGTNIAILEELIGYTLIHAT
jgi:hypothetical protein